MLLAFGSISSTVNYPANRKLDFFLTSLVDGVGDLYLAAKATEKYRMLRKRDIAVRRNMHSLIATYWIANKFSLPFTHRDFRPWCEHFELTDISRIINIT